MKKKIIIALVACMIIGCGLIFGLDLYVKEAGAPFIQTKATRTYDCILVLGAGLRNKKPSLMLQERLNTAYSLYKDKVSDKILVSGDHGTKGYDEVNAMKTYLKNKGVPSSDIFMDHAGFDTYDSMYRAKKVFEVKSMMIVTQKYHLYRALFLARSLGMIADGIDCQKKVYHGQTMRDLREILARDKAVFSILLKPKPILGPKINIHGNGNQTND